MLNTADIIFALLETRNIEQRELADFLGLKKQSISEWKAGRTHSYKKYIDKIADFFGVTTDYLLNGKAPVSVDEDDLLTLLRKTYSDEELKALANANRNEAEQVIDLLKKSK